MAKQDERDRYTPTEWARRNGVHPHSVRRWIRDGVLPAERFGGRWLIPARARPAASTSPSEARRGA